MSRRVSLGERQSLTLQAQVFNLLNHPNWYVQNGNGVNATQYQPVSGTCGDGQTTNQTCYLVPEQGFGTLQTINSLYGPRLFQFSLKWSF